jgi:CheY-like chemotaxis protein
MYSSEPSRCSVLVVDDDLAIREALIMALEDEGYQVAGAANGRDALDYLRQSPQMPQLILLDLMMPIMSGWDFRAEQEQDPSLAPIPVVVLSADRSIQAKAASVNADGYLQKPVDIVVLLDTVNQYCT